MNTVPVSKIKVESKLAVIRESLSELVQLGKISRTEFLSDKKNFAVAEHYLRRALEAIFDIAGHMISRYPMSPGNRPATYKELALAMVEKRIVDEEFGKDNLTRMAGYRNRMVHFYDEITGNEMYTILQEKLRDIEKFADRTITVLNNPEEYGLTVVDN
jgi:uncharacterized protein YutE (UPF0331/DUF86 family)